MNKANGSGKVRGDSQLEIANVELDDVFLASLVSLLGVAKLCKPTAAEADALAYACTVINKWHGALTPVQRDAWRGGTVACIQSVRAEEEANSD